MDRPPLVLINPLFLLRVLEGDLRRQSKEKGGRGGG